MPDNSCRYEKGCCCPMAHFEARTSTAPGPIVVTLTGDPQLAG
ncbi:hypothetical protein ACLQ28_10010 [Micromonospora sp. DT201]